VSEDEAPTTEHPMLAAIDQVKVHLQAVAAGNGWSMSDDALCRFLDTIAACEALTAAVKLAAVADADARNLGVAQATDTAGWLRARLLMHPATARTTVRLAHALRSDCPATGAALASGALTEAQAQVITETVTDLPPVEAKTKAAAEAFLIREAAVLDPVQLRRAGQRLREVLTSTPDADERALRQRDRRALHLVAAHDGMVLLRGQLDAESAAVLHATLDPLAAPRPAEDGAPDPRTPAQRRADALTDLARIALASGTLPASGGIRPTLTVTIDHDALTGRIRAAGLLPTGEVLSAAVTRRIGCDARILPVVLAGPSQPLDVGRSTRSIPPAIRAALVARDQGCAFPGCDGPGAWAEGHHIIHWADGGSTSLDNLVMLCLRHHQAVHHEGWTVGLDDEGLPFFRPPPWIDPDQRPRRHHRYPLRQLQYELTGPGPQQE
jgi:hypothetical protein